VKRAQKNRKKNEVVQLLGCGCCCLSFWGMGGGWVLGDE
jgi:hypothetical protein